MGYMVTFCCVLVSTRIATTQCQGDLEWPRSINEEHHSTASRKTPTCHLSMIIIYHLSTHLEKDNIYHLLLSVYLPTSLSSIIVYLPTIFYHRLSAYHLS